MSFVQRASRQARSSPSTRSHPLFATNCPSELSLRPIVDKANRGVKAAHDKVAAIQRQRLVVKRCLAEIVRLKPQFERMAGPGRDLQRQRGRSVYRDQRDDL